MPPAASPSTNRLRLIVGRATVVLPLVDEDGSPNPISLSLKKLGHMRIAEKAIRYPRVGQLIASFIDGTTGKDVAKVGIEKLLADGLGETEVTAGTVVGELVAEFPTLMQELVVESVELESGDTLQDLIDLVLGLDIDHFALLLNAFITLNFSRGVAPLAAALQTFGTLKRKDADASSNASATPSTDATVSAAA